MKRGNKEKTVKASEAGNSRRNRGAFASQMIHVSYDSTFITQYHLGDLMVMMVAPTCHRPGRLVPFPSFHLIFFRDL